MRHPITLSAAEDAQRTRYDARYLSGRAPVMRSIERCVCGCDYGADSWTTRVEADRMAASLGLREDVRLLDLGGGAGWPALYLAKTTKCDVVLADVSSAGLRVAAERAVSDGLSGTVSTCVADAASLPFSNCCFDAVSHSDLLCCLERKRAVLTECRRVIRPSGRMAFTVISVTLGPSSPEYVRAIASGPDFVATDTDYATLLAETGWIVAGSQDVSGDFAVSCRRQLQADEAHIAELATEIGERECSERLSGWRSKIVAIEEKLLRREYFVVMPRLN